MNEFIREEYDKAKFIAILLHETSDIVNKTQFSTDLFSVDDVVDIKKKF